MAEGDEDSGGGGGGGGGMDVGDTPTLVNGLLCSIMRAMTRSASSRDLADVIVRDASKEEIKTAWHQLFTLFKDVEDKAQKKSVIDIVRETTGRLAEDILKQLSDVERSTPGAVNFVFPWNYVIKEFETDNEYRAKEWEKEKSKQSNLKFEALEH